MPRSIVSFLAAPFTGLALLLSPFAAGAQAAADAAESLMRSSGLWAQLASIGPQVRAGFADGMAQSGGAATPAETERLARLIDHAYGADRMRAAALATLRQGLKAEHVPALRRWYDSGVGKTIARLEETAAAEQTDPVALARQAATLLTAMPADRRRLLDELIVATRSAETMVQLTIDTTLAAQRGVASVLPQAPIGSPDETRAALEAQRPQLLEAFTGLSLASYAKAYASLPTPDLRRYVVFLKSAPGKHFTDVGLQAFSAALVEASAELGRGLPGTRDKANT